VVVNRTNLWTLIQVLTQVIALQKSPARVVSIIQAGTIAPIVFQIVKPVQMSLVNVPNANQPTLEQGIPALVTQILK